MITSEHPILLSPRAATAEDTHIDVTAPEEVDYWSDALGVSEAQLRIAVANVGVSMRDVRDHLGR